MKISLMRRLASTRAFTIMEALIAVGASTLLMAGLVGSVVMLLRSFNNAQEFSRYQASQVRAIDAIAMDLRRAAQIHVYLPSSATTQKVVYSSDAYPYPTGFLTISSTCYLVINEPGYYKSNDPTTTDYTTRNQLITVGIGSNPWGITYGTNATTIAPETIVRYEMGYDSLYGSTCLIRREGTQADYTAGTTHYKVIADHADGLYVDITPQKDMKSFLIEAWIQINASLDQAKVYSSDSVMLRNARED